MPDFAPACRYSPFLKRLFESGAVDPQQLAPLLNTQLNTDYFHRFADWQAFIDTNDEAGIASALRRLRRYVLAHIISKDLLHLSTLDEVTQTITLFADFAINQALNFAHHDAENRYGTPIGQYSKQAQFLTVIAMGKMGGRELNVSSDIDLIFTYPEAGETNGSRSRSNQEFFTKVGQKLITLLNDTTADGQVFRVDMRLRPDGDAGPLVLSETALEQYLISQGREWERYAWCKGRVVTPHTNGIADLVRPFVYRKYLDYNAYAAMRNLHEQIRREVSAKALTDNIKLGSGGIREIEFIAQIFQMIRGGHIRSLQLKGTQETLSRLNESGMLTTEDTEALLAAYRFLRHVEHRLQYWDDQQTQTLPESPQQQTLLAKSMGFADYATFLHTLNQHRHFVDQFFNNLLTTPDQPNTTGQLADWQHAWQPNPIDQEAIQQHLTHHGFHAETVLQRLHLLRHSSKYRQLSAQAQNRFDAVVPLLLDAAAQSSNPDATLDRLLNFLETISRRASYLAFLQEHPHTIEQLAQLMAQSSWVADYLTHHPILLDELLSAQLMDNDTTNSALAAELSDGLNHCNNDPEAQMDTLRHFQHTQVFRLAVQDLAGLWTVEALSDQLSALADLTIESAMPAVWHHTPKTHTDQPRFAVIGYGKLGGKELGYTSDLDLVYLYEDNHPDAADIYGRYARRLTNWLSASTNAGTLYDIDLRLRPNGDSGFLASSLSAFTRYQHEQAWTWEHQSLTRARFVCGDPAIGTAFEQLRADILSQKRDTQALASDILSMRQKISASHPALTQDTKYARGGIVDVEFIVQYLILAHAHRYPALLDNYGNIALLRIAADAGLIDSDAAEHTATAYRFFRQQQHNTKIRDSLPHVSDDILHTHYAHVRRLWEQVFGEAAT